ncbi:hypothetical protein [Nonlabens sp.]|uniref:hypothetical protein n=1 Tax=Nonlabens sp. TaxID=1888209 RepID=UPI001BD08E7C|nr:hypothetical protein [Nonlabens sp.]
MRVFFIYALLSFGLYTAHAQQSTIVKSLADQGFENVAAVQKGVDLYITYENNLYRFEAKGLANIIAQLTETDLSLYERIHFLLRSQDIPMAMATLSTSDLNAYKSGLIDRYTLASSMQFSIEIDKAESYFKEAERENLSFYKIDVPVGVRLDYLLGDFRDGFQSRTYVNSRVLSTFGRGTEFEFDFLNIVQNDIPGRAISSPVTMKVTQSARFGQNTFLSASLGYLPQGKFGLYTRFRNYLDEERFYLELIYGVTRTGYLDQNWVVQNNRNSDALWQAIFNYRWNKYDTDLNFTYGTFDSADLGYKFQVQRQFNEVYFSLFYSRTDLASSGSFGSEQPAIIGFSMTVPFGQSKFIKPGRIRARTEDQFYLLYRYSGFSFSGIDVMFANDIFSDIREFYPEVLRKGLMKHLK